MDSWAQVYLHIYIMYKIIDNFKKISTVFISPFNKLKKQLNLIINPWLARKKEWWKNANKIPEIKVSELQFSNN